MRLSLRLAWRNIWRHRRRTLIVVLAIGFILALMMFYDGLIAGFDQAIYGNAIKVLGGNIQIHAVGYSDKASQNPLLPLTNDQKIVSAAKAQPQVVAASRRIVTGGMTTNHVGAFGVSIVGIEPEIEQPVNLIAQHVTSGRFLMSSDQDQILIGKGLAEEMGITTGDRITLAGQGTHSQMRQRTMTVVGIYDLGMADLEKQSVYISLAEAQNLYGLSGQTTEVALTLKQIGQEPAVMNALTPLLPDTEIQSWAALFPELQAAIDTKGAVMNVFSIIILIIAGIGILNLLLMAVYERTREIGVLGAFGFKPREISLLFILEGAMMGLVGIAFGVGLGLLINILLGRAGLDFSSFSTMTSYMALVSGKIYPSLGLEKLAQHVVTVLIITVLASFIPANEASHNEPAEALHYV
ncbi:MAG TPA: FtsX-like permease family protein [Anaerolineaceae bacterium]|jgi:putative ABC transport system permease protein